ncbi:MAG: S8/S53 family peptidase, partial [Planctomycetota bacterium]
MSISLYIPGVAPTAEQPVAIGTSSEDTELVILEVDGDRWRAEVQIQVTDDGVQHDDGVVQAKRGSLITAIWTEAGTAKQAIAIAMTDGFETPGNFQISIDPSVQPPVAQTAGRLPGEAPRPLGAIANDDGKVVSFAREELIVSRQRGEVGEMLRIPGVREMDYGNTPGVTSAPFALVRGGGIADVEDAEVVLELLGATGHLRVSDQQTLGLLLFMAEARLRDMNVSLNLIAEFHGQPSSGDRDGAGGEKDMFATTVGRDALIGVQRAWMQTAVTERELSGEEKVTVAVIDSDFCPQLAGVVDDVGGFDFEHFSSDYLQISDLRFGKIYHGTSMATIIGEFSHNGEGAAGVANQVANLLLYQVGNIAYLYDVGLALHAAVLDGADVISMSLGFPCAFLPLGINWCEIGLLPITCTLLGPLFDIAFAIAQTHVPVPLPPAGAICPFAVTFFSGAKSLMEHGVAVAELAGRTTVASSGNKLGAIPASPIELFHVIPGMLPGVVCVAAHDATYQNTHFFGLRPDVWAPEYVERYKPGDDTGACSNWGVGESGGSSPSAAFVAANIALWKASNPRLTPAGVRNNLWRNTRFAPGGDLRVLRFMKCDEVQESNEAYLSFIVRGVRLVSKAVYQGLVLIRLTRLLASIGKRS